MLDRTRCNTLWARRDILVARVQKCRETISVSQVSLNCHYPQPGVIFNNAFKPSLVGERRFKRQVAGKGICESKTVAGQWGGKFWRGRHLDVPHGQRGRDSDISFY